MAISRADIIAEKQMNSLRLVKWCCAIVTSLLKCNDNVPKAFLSFAQTKDNHFRLQYKNA